MNLQEKIAKARAEFEATEPTILNVEVGGEITALGFRPVWGQEWVDLLAVNPPRPGSENDTAVGYNTDAVASDYPASAVTVDGDPVSADDWRDLVAVLSAPNRNNIASVLYVLNQLEPARKLAAAGKALKG